jgi:tRNA(Ile)-lysidine synthase
VRYAFLERAARQLDADVIATGHTLDDQAETFLLQLIRGAGPRGLSSIAPVVGLVRRPLLELRRQEIREWLAAERISFRDDETNRDLTFARNRVRHVLLPLLEREFSQGIIEVLAREAAIARDDEAYLQSVAIESARSIVLGTEGIVEIDAAALNSLAPAVATRVVRIALARLGSGRYIGYEHIQGLLALAGLPAPSGLSLPGQYARRVGDRILLGRRPPAGFVNSFRVPLSIPGEVLLDRQGWAVSAELGSTLAVVRSGGLEVAVRPEQVSLPLAVRSRRRGDRLRPAGLRGRRKKLQDLFVDRKIARHERDGVPLVVDNEDRILWVVGHAVAEDFRVTEPSQGVLLLKARRLGGLG